MGVSDRSKSLCDCEGLQTATVNKTENTFIGIIILSMPLVNPPDSQDGAAIVTDCDVAAAQTLIGIRSCMCATGTIVPRVFSTNIK